MHSSYISWVIAFLGVSYSLNRSPASGESIGVEKGGGVAGGAEASQLQIRGAKLCTQDYVYNNLLTEVVIVLICVH